MNEIKRYDLSIDAYSVKPIIEEDEYINGEWCKYSDVEKLIKENQDLIETIQAMIKIGEAVK